MNILQDKDIRHYVTFLGSLLMACILMTLFLSWFHGKEAQALLFEREQTMVSSLMEQGVSRTSIARAVKTSVSTKEGVELMRQLGHTPAASVRRFPAIEESVYVFGKTAVGMVMLLMLLLWGRTVWFLLLREKLYRKAEGIITQFSEGNFQNHLPQNENGGIYQLFAAVEELAVSLQAHSEKQQHMKAFLKDTISDISHQLKTPLAALNIYNGILQGEAENLPTIKEFPIFPSRTWKGLKHWYRYRIC